MSEMISNLVFFHPSFIFHLSGVVLLEICRYTQSRVPDVIRPYIVWNVP